jgi:penicillin-binding protein 1A
MAHQIGEAVPETKPECRPVFGLGGEWHPRRQGALLPWPSLTAPRAPVERPPAASEATAPPGAPRPVEVRHDHAADRLAVLFLLALPVVLAFHAAESVQRARRWVHAAAWRRAAVGVPAAAAALALIATGAVLSYVQRDREKLPSLAPFLRFEPPTIGPVYDADGELVIEMAKEYRRLLAYPDLPPVVGHAILAAEDKNFFSHDGVDYGVLPRVLWKAVAHTVTASVEATWRDGALTLQVVLPQGGSTITQQLVRVYFLPELTRMERADTLMRDTWLTRLLARAFGIYNANRLTRKLEEARLAVWLEQHLRWWFGSKQRVKEEILARYASFVYLGNGRYGVAAASEYYFDRPLASYTPDNADEAALLAGITKSPSQYAPTATNLDRPRERRDEVLALMARAGMLSPDQARAFQGQPIQLAAQRPTKTIAPAAVAGVFGELKDIGGGVSLDRLLEGRIRVHSTLRNALQRIVNESLENGLRAYEARHPGGKGLIQGSAVVLGNRDARILAEAGGREFYRNRLTRYSDYNRVRDSWRQPGSALKPIVYLAAFRRGTSLESEVADSPTSVSMGSGRPRKWIANYDGEFEGLIPIRRALAESRNAATVRVTQQVGLDDVLETARLLGIHSPLHRYLSTALGASGVTLLELANAYRAIAAGTAAEPYVIQKVTDPEGSPLFERADHVQPLAVPGAALERIQEGLRGVVRLPSGTGHSLDREGFPVPVMGKTGTTSDFRDALFVGSTYGPAGITVAVRVGYDDNRPLGDKETGARTALPIFSEIVLRAYEGGLVGPAPRFPARIEEGIDAYLAGVEHASLTAADASAAGSELLAAWPR